jgi:hypothetical protein
MKRFIAVLMLVTMNMSIASAANLKVTQVEYNQSEQSFTVITEVSKMCDTELAFRVRGCTDLVVPYTCMIDVIAEGGQSCKEDSMAIATISLDQLDLYRREMSGGTVVFQNEKGKTRQTIKLSILK